MKTILLSGASGGIGPAIAERLAADGHRVVALYRSAPAPEMERWVSSLPGTGHRAFRCDLADAETVRATLGQAVAASGPIDICIHAATSRLTRKTALELSPDEIREDFNVGFFGGFNLFQAVAPQMRERKAGRIIGITTAALEPNAMSGKMGGYVPAKAALRQLLRDMARELAPFGITVNAVAPGFVATPLNQDLPAKVAEFAQEKNPLKHLTTPRDVAGVASFLCSDDAAFLTGVSIPVCGGDVMTL